jgi:DNA-binding MarR family transcriptional regulator
MTAETRTAGTRTAEKRATHVVTPARLWRLPSWLLTHVAGRSYRLVIDHLDTVDDRTNYAILAALEEFGPISQATLGRHLALDRSDVVAFLNRLEEDRLVTRRPDQRDPRQNSVKITRSGLRLLHRLDHQVDEAQDALLAPLSAAEREQFVGLLERLVEHHTPLRRPG